MDEVEYKRRLTETVIALLLLKCIIARRPGKFTIGQVFIRITVQTEKRSERERKRERESVMKREKTETEVLQFLLCFIKKRIEEI